MIYQIRDVSFTYPGGERKILDKVSLDLEEGQILSVLGPNGAGKTTLLNCMAGLLVPEKGSIKLCGNDIQKMKPKDIARIVGYVPQIHTPTFDYTVLDFVLMGRAPKISAMGKPSKNDTDMCYNVLADMGIEHLAQKSYIEISGGERQQALIARAIVQEPKVILFDEPTAHLDYGNQYKVLNIVRKMAAGGFAVIITTHNPDHALLLGDRTAIVGRDGSLTSGRAEEIVTEERLAGVYKTKIKLLKIPEVNRVACITPKLEEE